MGNTEKKLLLGRFLTRSGDQAWDFAMPLVLLVVLPGSFQVAVFLYLLIIAAQVLLLPRVTSLLDSGKRSRSIQLGIYLQAVGVIGGAGGIYFLSQGAETRWPALFTIGISGVLSSLGAGLMEVAVSNDLMPAVVPESSFTRFNAWVRRIDLATEVASPVLAGLILLLSTQESPLVGFWVVVAWNLFSFFPELFLIRSIFRQNPKLLEEKISTERPASFFLQLSNGWNAFFREPAALAMLAYSFLWLSALSPHGVLLTAFLKDGWNLPEWEIGIFRGLGAVFGLFATVLFPLWIKKIGVISSSKQFIWFQAAILLLALGFFLLDGREGQYAFLALVLVSRIGLYGFSLGEQEIRQRAISPKVAGKVNGFAYALNNLGTLVLYLVGTLLGSAKNFMWMVVFSASAVMLAAFLFQLWTKMYERKF